MKNAAQPRDAVSGEAYTLPHSLPWGLHEALELFGENKAVRELFGETFCDIYSAIKKHELHEFQRVISPWEREHLLLNV